MLEEVIVTATRRDVALRDVPITVSVFPREEIERQRIIRPQDFIGQVSNVSLATVGRPGESNVSMRGIQGNFGLTQPVAVVVDEVVAANPQALDFTAQARFCFRFVVTSRIPRERPCKRPGPPVPGFCTMMFR